MLRAYACAVKGWESPEGPNIVHALSASKARYSYWRDVRDCWPDLPYINVRCRCLGAPRDTAKFRHTADYRKAWFHIGDKVTVHGCTGYVADSTSGANFEVHFIDGKYQGAELACHISEIERVPEDANG